MPTVRTWRETTKTYVGPNAFDVAASADPSRRYLLIYGLVAGGTISLSSNAGATTSSTVTISGASGPNARFELVNDWQPKLCQQQWFFKCNAIGGPHIVVFEEFEVETSGIIVHSGPLAGSDPSLLGILNESGMDELTIMQRQLADAIRRIKG